MDRLIEGKGDNTPETYNKIFVERQIRELDWQDERRWKKMFKYYRGGNLLDIGCLDSKITTMARLRKRNVAVIVGTDVADLAVKKMQAANPHNRYYVDDIFKTKMPEGYFDYVCMGELLEHVEEPVLAIINAMELVKPGGWLVISTPLNEAIEPGAVDKERHLWSFTKQDMKKIFTNLGDFEKLKFKVLRSKYFPKYKYCFKQLIVYIKKHEN